jgi:hypothetical protein
LEDQARNTPQTAAADPYAGLPLEDLQALYRDWGNNPTPRPELEALTLPELTALYFRTIRGPA